MCNKSPHDAAEETLLPGEEAYQDINLTTDDKFGLFKSVVCGSLRSSLNLVKSRCEVCGRLGLGADGVEVGGRCVLALGEGDELVAGAFDDGERDEVRHCNVKYTVSPLGRSMEICIDKTKL